jgi:uroporphyrinogen III methyltransferase/synthase
MQSKSPKVYLVGAGPGDPGLITVKGMGCIAAADAVIYDYLAAPALLKHAAQDAELIYVGKKGGDHTLPQEEINALIVAKAREGKVVTRLKGGDPFVFGRGGEEAEVLVEAGIPYEIVPGVTSAVAAPAYAGIPLSHRQLTSTIAFVTGHEDPRKADSSIDWASLAKGIGTLVFFMGVKNLPRIVAELLANGRSPETPVALVRWGTTRSSARSGTRRIIARSRRQLKAPAIIVFGSRAARQTAWFETAVRQTHRGHPLREQASDLVRSPRTWARTLECPRSRWLADDRDLSNGPSRIAEAHWWFCRQGQFLFERLLRSVRCPRPGPSRTVCISPATAERLKSFGLKAISFRNFRAESIIEAFRRVELHGRTILLPRARKPADPAGRAGGDGGRCGKRTTRPRPSPATRLPPGALEDKPSTSSRSPAPPRSRISRPCCPPIASKSWSQGCPPLVSGRSRPTPPGSWDSTCASWPKLIPSRGFAKRFSAFI